MVFSKVTLIIFTTVGLVEHAVESGLPPPTECKCTEPLLRLVHGLPGSGKTEVLRWLQSYFEQVWNWTLGVQFDFVAPLNSMASNINGKTVHSWGQVGFKDRRGMTINMGKRSASEEVPSMAIKANATRFLFIDEIEATGADTIGSLEHNVVGHMSSKNEFKYKPDNDWRPFGGMNVCFLGDFWQLNPTGQIALMSDVTSEKVRENATAQYIMNMFWDSGFKDSLQEWHAQKRVLHLETNIRSGADAWFSKFLDACRKGELDEDDYNFLHGLPTTKQIQHWYHRRNDSTWVHEVWCQRKANCVAFYWKPSDAQPAVEDNPLFEPDIVLKEKNFLECADCFRERKRRARVLHVDEFPDDAQRELSAPAFVDSVYITPFNKVESASPIFFCIIFFLQNNCIEKFWIECNPLHASFPG